MDRFQAGDIAQVDLDRLELGRVQYEQDNETADVNVRTAKIQLLQLLNDRTPVDQFDVTGPYEFMDALMPLDQYHQLAITGRPDLQAAIQTVEKAKIDHSLAIANGSTDPTFGFDAAHQPYPLDSYIGVSVNIPLRIFDRNQGEKQRTLLDIDLQQQQAGGGAGSRVFRCRFGLRDGGQPVEAAAALQGTSICSRRSVCAETISFSYQHGGASLLDFLQAQSDYRGGPARILKFSRCLSDRRGADERGRRTRGASVNVKIFAAVSIAAGLMMTGCDKKGRSQG